MAPTAVRWFLRQPDELVAEIEKIDNYFDIPLANMQTAVEDGMIQIIGKEVDDAYAAAVENVVKANPGSDLKVIYTPSTAAAMCRCAVCWMTWAIRM